ncbi:MAG: protein kinase [Planctomycetes bacterium]|nr:protein kinase [Planctomycetota bacterium]
MVLNSVDILIDALRETNLLRPEQVSQLVKEIGPKFEDTQELAKHIVRLGWITLYQAKKLLSGHGKDLILGHYVILDKLGEGGMGKVYKAKQLRLSRTVALKVIRPSLLANEMTLKRFHREAKSAAQLAHPNIVRLFDADQVGDRHFLAMEFVEGIDLTKLVKETGPLPVGMACSFIRQAASGLQHAHDLGLVHRDIKPSNLLVSAPNTTGKAVSGGVIKILDMGLARAMIDNESDASITALTQDGTVIGTPDFMSPEQAKNSSTVDARSDLYSLGCTLYYLLTGQSPFPHGTTMEKLIQHQMDQPSHINLIRNDVPDGVALIVHKLLAKKPEERYQSGKELATALEPWSVFDPSNKRLSASGKHARPDVVPEALPVASDPPTPISTDSKLFNFEPTEPEPAPLPRPEKKIEVRPHQSVKPEAPKRSRKLWWIAGSLLVLAILVGGFFATRALNKEEPPRTEQNQAKEEPKAPIKPPPVPAKKYDLDTVDFYFPADTDSVAILNVVQLNKSKFFKDQMLPHFAEGVNKFLAGCTLDPFKMVDRAVVASTSGRPALSVIVIQGPEILNAKFLNWVDQMPGVIIKPENIPGQMQARNIYSIPGNRDLPSWKQEHLFGTILSQDPPTIVLSATRDRVIDCVTRIGMKGDVRIEDASLKNVLEKYSPKVVPTLWFGMGGDSRLFAMTEKKTVPAKNGAIQGVTMTMQLTESLIFELEIESKDRVQALAAHTRVVNVFRFLANANKSDTRLDRIAALVLNARNTTPKKADLAPLYHWRNTIAADKLAEWFGPFLVGEVGKTEKK